MFLPNFSDFSSICLSQSNVCSDVRKHVAVVRAAHTSVSASLGCVSHD